VIQYVKDYSCLTNYSDTVQNTNLQNSSHGIIAFTVGFGVDTVVGVVVGIAVRQKKKKTQI